MNFTWAIAQVYNHKLEMSVVRIRIHWKKFVAFLESQFETFGKLHRKVKSVLDLQNPSKHGVHNAKNKVPTTKMHWALTEETECLRSAISRQFEFTTNENTYKNHNAYHKWNSIAFRFMRICCWIFTYIFVNHSKSLIVFLANVYFMFKRARTINSLHSRFCWFSIFKFS